jgi:hypothetical protein
MEWSVTDGFWDGPRPPISLLLSEECAVSFQHAQGGGTGLFYRNAAFPPGIVDIQSATLDDPNALPAQSHIQTAERIGWMAEVHHLPLFERFPE